MENNIIISGVKLKNFVDLTDNEKVEILEWRNNIEVRKVMFEKEEISLENHLRFIESLKNNKSKLYYLAEMSEKSFGVIDYYNIQEKEAWWGYYVKPELIGKSFGVLLEFVVLEYAFNELKLEKLKCETLEINKPVVKLHNSFGFKEVQNIDGVVEMEITKDVWNNKRGLFEKMIEKLKVI